MWETNPSMTPKKLSSLSMGLEMVTGPTPCKLYDDDDDDDDDRDSYTLHFFNHALGYTYVTRNNKIHTFLLMV